MKNILIIEYEIIIGEDITASLEHNGYNIAGVFASGKKALSFLETQTPDLILMDTNLRTELDGISTAQKIKELYNIPIIFISTSSDNDMVRQVEKIGAAALLSKPFSENELVNNIEIALYKNRMESDLKQVNSVLKERLKELNYLYTLSQIMQKHNITIPDTLEQAVRLIPAAWQFPEKTCAKIVYKDLEFLSDNFCEANDFIRSPITIQNEEAGFVQVFCHEMPSNSSNIFSDEEVSLLYLITERLSNFIEKIVIQEGLASIEEQFRVAFEDAATGMVVCDLNGKFLRVNQEYCDITGYSRDELLKMTFRQLTYDKDLKEEMVLVNNLLEGKIKKYNLEKRYITKDKKIIWVEINISIVRDKNTNPRFFIGQIQDISEKKLLRKKANQYLDITPTIILELNHDYSVKMINHKGSELLGYEFNDIIGKNWFDKFVPAASKKEIVSAFNSISKGDINQIYNNKYHVLTKNGEKRLISWHNIIITNEVDEITTILSSGEDITEQTKTKIALIESEQKFKNMYLNTPIGIARVSLDYSILEANQSYCRMLGYEESELVGKKIFDITHPEVLEENKRKQAQLGRGEIPYFQMEKAFIHKKGHTIYGLLNSTLIRDHDGNPAYFIGNVLDITERKRYIQNLRESEELLSLALEIVDAGIWIWNIKTDEIYIGPRFLKILGYDRDELPLTLQEQKPFHHDDDWEHMIHELNRHIRGETDIYKHHHRGLTKSGKWIWLSTRAKITEYDENNNPVKMVGTATDITDQILTEQNLTAGLEKIKEADKLKTAFLANMSHEIRTPLNGIIGFVDLMLMEDDLNDEHKEQLMFIKENGKLLLSLINDILDIARIESGQVSVNNQPFSLSSLFINIKNLANTLILRNQKPIEFIQDYHSNIEEMIIGDFTKLNQVMNNLIANAIKFTNQGKVVCGAMRQDKNTLRFYVKDTGIGIPEDKWEYIFNPFHQLDEQITIRYGGTGLGLAICKKLVELMKGNIWLNSKVGQGTVFYFTVPYMSTEEIKPKKIETTEQSDINTKYTILVAEDKLVNQIVIDKMLNKKGFQVIIANHGQEAIDNYMSDTPPDLILMDIRMPVMDGIEATKQIREIEKTGNKKRIPIIALTAAALDEDRYRGMQAGCDDYIVKPFEMAKLMSAMKKYLK